MPRPRWHLEIRIIKTPPPSFEGFDTSRFEIGRVYDVNAPLCDLLVTSGYAVDNTAPNAPPPSTDPPRHQAHDQPRTRKKPQ